MCTIFDNDKLMTLCTAAKLTKQKKSAVLKPSGGSEERQTNLATQKRMNLMDMTDVYAKRFFNGQLPLLIYPIITL